MALYQLDLGSLKSVRKCAKDIIEKEDHIDILINNAGVMMCPLLRTEDNFEMQIGTNHLGHFLFTNLLVDKLKASAPARIINLSSLAHEMGFIDLQDLNYETRKYDSFQAYAQSKLANILFTRELSRRVKNLGITCYAVHPGAVETELARHIEDWFGSFKDVVMTLMVPFFKIFWKRPIDGCQTSVDCAVNPLLANETGKYYADCKEKEPMFQAKDDRMAKMLWDQSENLVELQK